MPRSNGRKWVGSTLNTMIQMIEAGYTQREVARQLRRTPKAVESKARRVRLALGLRLRRSTYMRLPFSAVVQNLATRQELETVVPILLGD